jgi:hypothetical protein
MTWPSDILAKRVIAADLQRTEFADFTRIYNGRRLGKPVRILFIQCTLNSRLTAEVFAVEKRIQDLSDAITQTAADKRRAAEARGSGSGTAPGSARVVYLDACQQIATSFEQEGFRYAKSRQAMTRSLQDWKQCISFQSSVHNVAGARVAIWVHANIGSTRLKKWRDSNSALVPADHVGGGQLGNLLNPPRWFDYDVADSQRRTEVVDEVIADLKRIALPYFERFMDLDKLVADMLREDIPQVAVASAVEFLLCYRNKSVAAEYVLGWLSRHPELRTEITALVEVYRQNGLPQFPRGCGYGTEVATLVVLHELDVQLA